MDAYSQLKPLHHPERLEELRAGISPAPVHVQLILSDLCNQDCYFCAYRMSGGLSTELFATAKTHNPNRKIATGKALEIIGDCAEMGVKAIQFTGGGEPTVHKNCLDIIGHAQLLGLDTALVTNGIRLDVDDPRTGRLKWLRISVDAGHVDTYCKVRRVTPAHWDKLWANIEALRDFKGNFGAGFVVTNENYTEIPALAMRCTDFGVPYLRIGAVFSAQGLDYYDDVNDIHHYIEAAREFESKTFKIVDLFGRRLADLENASPDFEFCGYQYFTTYIGADLNVYRCCNTAYISRGNALKTLPLAGRPLMPEPVNFASFWGRIAPSTACWQHPPT
jgi:MoaA/NifB/PqqE/SkfB family radical SAM enzyme